MAVFRPEYGFPAVYNENYLSLMVRDPGCIFAYWEFSEEQMAIVAKRLDCDWGRVPLVMRIFDQTGLFPIDVGAHSYFDLSIHPLANNYYIRGIEANHSYYVEIGVISGQDDRFVALLRSNIVQTPREGLADGSELVLADLLERDVVVDNDKEAQLEIESFSSQGVYMDYKKNDD